MRKPSNHLRNILATNIRNFRIQKKLSQEKFAEICDLHRTYIGADVLDVSVPELLTELKKL